MVPTLIVIAGFVGIPAPDLQGDWNCLEISRRNGWDGYETGTSYFPGQHVWKVRGVWAGSGNADRTASLRLELMPNPALGLAPTLPPELGGPTILQYTDLYGRTYSGTYTVTGGKAVFKLNGWVRIPGGDGTEGGQTLTIVLERPRPRPPQPAPRTFSPGSVEIVDPPARP